MTKNQCGKVACFTPVVPENYACVPHWLELSVSTRVDVVRTQGVQNHERMTAISQALQEWNGSQKQGDWGG